MDIGTFKRKGGIEFEQCFKNKHCGLSWNDLDPEWKLIAYIPY